MKPLTTLRLLPPPTPAELAAALRWHDEFYRRWMREIAPLMLKKPVDNSVQPG